MYCPTCDEFVCGSVQYCRKCGSRLLPEDSEITKPITNDTTGSRPAPFFPPSGNRGVPISSPATTLLSRAEAVSDICSLMTLREIRGFPEEPLGFSIEPTTFENGVELVLQHRGLLQIKDSYWDQRYHDEVPLDHLDLSFARKEHADDHS